LEVVNVRLNGLSNPVERLAFYTRNNPHPGTVCRSFLLSLKYIVAMKKMQQLIYNGTTLIILSF
jgi:hypothetical protein